MPRIFMPPRGIVDDHKLHHECMIYGQCLEITFEEEGDLQIDNPQFFTAPFVGGHHPSGWTSAKYYAAADKSHTIFHFTAIASGEKYKVELKVRDDCHVTEPCVP